MNTSFSKSFSLGLLGVNLMAILSLTSISALAQAGNTATGSSALHSNTTGNYNSASGMQALNSNTTGNYNTANGYQALCTNSTGVANMAHGSYALYFNTIGNYNVAGGFAALYSNTSGSNNTASGYESLYSNTTGNYNTAYGYQALLLTNGNFNLALGYGAGQNLTNGNNNIAIGNTGLAADNGVIRIGTVGTQSAAFIAGINGITSSNGVPVYINANGQLGTLTSSARFKFDIKSLGAKSEKLMDLRPVSFRYKEATTEGEHPIQYGLIAEEVAKVYPDMVQYDKEGKPFTVFYQQLTPMMLNELQKAHHQEEAQGAEIEALKAAQQKQSAELAELKQMLQKQSAGNNPAPRPTALIASALAACLAGAFLLSIRMRQSR